MIDSCFTSYIILKGITAKINYSTKTRDRLLVSPKKIDAFVTRTFILKTITAKKLGK